MNLVVLCDNTTANPALRAAHGWSVWVETTTGGVLFDTGPDDRVVMNAAVLDVPLARAQAVVLSHGHYDHTGGLAAVLAASIGTSFVHGHPAILLPKFRQSLESGTRNIGMPAAGVAAIERLGTRWRPARGPVEVAPGIWTTGEIPRRHPEEQPEEGFCLDEGCRRLDPLLDDQALFVPTAEGTVVVLGCAHAGVINTLEYIQTLTAGAPLRALIGGLHLRNSPLARLRWTAAGLARLGVRRLLAAHCTGDEAGRWLRREWPEGVEPCGAGRRIAFN